MNIGLGPDGDIDEEEIRAPERQPGAEWPPQRAREAALRDLGDRIVSHPDAVSLRFEAGTGARAFRIVR